MTDTANTEAARMGSTRAAKPAALRRRSRTRIVLPAVASAAVVSAALASVTLSQPARPAAPQSPSLDSIAQAQAQGYSAVLVTGEDTGVEAEAEAAAPSGREEETVVVTITTPEPTPSQTPSQQDSAPSQSSDSGSAEASTSSSSSGSAPSGGATHYPVGELQEYAAQQAAANYGWGSDQMSCLIQLWERESNWNPNAHNASSGAHGIPQALPGSKMGPGWESDPHVQINWGLGYIAGRYGTPCGAWGHSESVGWY